MNFFAGLAMLALGLAACASPEARRGRGDGPGADVGNRTRIVELHGGSAPYWETPKIIIAQSAPLDSAQQARNVDTGRPIHAR